MEGRQSESRKRVSQPLRGDTGTTLSRKAFDYALPMRYTGQDIDNRSINVPANSLNIIEAEADARLTFWDEIGFKFRIQVSFVEFITYHKWHNP